MADRSAEVLAEVVLASDPADAAAMLSEQLTGDPPLVVWAVVQAHRRDQVCPQSVEGLADWLARNALDVLQWPAEHCPTDNSQQSLAETYGDLVCHRLELADAAALLAAPDGQPAVQRAYLGGLLYDARQWLDATSASPRSDASGALPHWLTEFTQTLAAPQLAEAVELLGGRRPPAAVDFDRQACHHRALEARRLWLAAVAGLGSRLPQLTARLGRLAALERDFAGTLLSEKLDSLAEFAAGAGHEINNPLAIIGGRAQLLLKEERDPERRRELAVINTQVRRAHEMIADMRLFARPPRPEPEMVDLVVLVDALIADLSPMMLERAVSLRRTGQDGPLAIEADPAQLHVAFRALCKNSLESIGHTGQIEISLAGSGDAVEICVSDDGPGIPPEHQRHVFDPFYSARQAGRGLGLGLSKCWRIVTNHGGRIDLTSRPGQGASFAITLPCRFRAPSN